MPTYRVKLQEIITTEVEIEVKVADETLIHEAVLDTLRHMRLHHVSWKPIDKKTVVQGLVELLY